MDDASMHKIDIVKEKIKECKTKISMIPGGLTRYLQPLDVSINKPFKDELKKRYTRYCIDQKDTKARVTQEDLINWVGEIWYDDKLSSEMISKSFNTAGITLAQDGSEDEMFIGHNSLLEDDQVMVEQVEQPADEQDEEMKDAEIDDIILFEYATHIYSGLHNFCLFSCFSSSNFGYTAVLHQWTRSDAKICLEKFQKFGENLVRIW